MPIRKCKCMENMREEWKTENPNINYVRFDMANVGG